MSEKNMNILLDAMKDIRTDMSKMEVRLSKSINKNTEDIKELKGLIINNSKRIDNNEAMIKKLLATPKGRESQSREELAPQN